MPSQTSSICPPTPPASIKSSPTLTPLANEAVACCTCACNCAEPPRKSKLSFSTVFDLFLKLIGLICAILFGVWAPLSYYLQRSANQGNDELTDEVKKLSKEVAEQRREMSILAMLRGLEFCEGDGRATLPACSAFSSSFQIDALFRGLMAPPTQSPTHTTPARYPPPHEPTATDILDNLYVVESWPSYLCNASFLYEYCARTEYLPTLPKLPSKDLVATAEVAFIVTVLIMLGWRHVGKWWTMGVFIYFAKFYVDFYSYRG